MSSSGLNYAVMAVTLIGWIGIFVAVFVLDRRVKKLEER